LPGPKRPMERPGCGIVAPDESLRLPMLDVPLQEVQPIPGCPIPPDSCRAYWVPRTSCAFPYRKAHTRSCPVLRGRNPGSFALFAKGGIPRISMHTVAYPTLETKNGFKDPDFLLHCASQRCVCGFQ
jgi:hypothetical protein